MIRPSISVVVATLAAAGNVQAQGTANHAEEEIVVLGRWDNPLGLSRAAADGVVGQAELEARPRLRTGEILEAVPGLIVTQHSGGGKSNQMFLRGFNLDHGTDFATFLDGMPVNLPTHGHGQGYTDLNFLIPELVERIEYRKGGFYAEVPDFSSAGAAYLSTFRRLDEGLLKVGAGEDGYRTALVADSVAASTGQLTYAVAANRYDGPWTDVREDLEREHALVRYSAGSAANGWGVAFMGYEGEWSSADQVPLRAVESGAVSRFGSIDRGLGGTTSRYSLSGDWRGDVGPGSLNLSAYTIDYALDLFSNFTYLLDDPENGDQFEQLDDRRVSGADARYRLERGSTAHTFGAALRFDDIFDVGLFHTRDRERIATVRRDTVRELALGAHYAAETRWNERLRSVLGVRADRYDFDVESDLAVNSGRAGDSLLSPKLSLIYALGSAAELHASAGRGFHSNDARGTTITIDPASGEPVESVDPLVASRSFEIGVRAFRADRFNVSASLWRVELDSELLFIGDAGNTEASRPSTRYGIEVPLYYRVAERVTLDFELARSEAFFTEPDPAGDEIPGSIDRVLAAGVSFDQPRGFYGSARLRYFGPRPLVEDGSVTSDSSLVFNAGLGYRTASVDFRVDVLNLFDGADDDITYFYASRLPGEPPEGVEDKHFHPLEPRTVRAHASWRF